MDNIDEKRVENAIRELLIGIGEDPDREGLQDTPSRVARACKELFSGLHENPSDHLKKQFNEDKHEEMVILTNIPFSSMCEHHLLPFSGHANVAYIPRNGVITGLSKIARCIDGFAKRPQVQERLTSQIADAFMEELNPLGVFITLEADHSCMRDRGVRKPGAITVTSAVRGSFQNDPKTRAEALALFKTQ